MQSSPVGEYQSRLDLVWSFRCAEATPPACMPSGSVMMLDMVQNGSEVLTCTCMMSRATCRCQALHGGSDALALAAVMQNIHTYYKQFQYLVQEDLQKGLAPIEKHLKACA